MSHDMATYVITIIAAMLFAQAFSATLLSQNSIEGTSKSPVSLSYEELIYILQARNGVNQKTRTLSPCARAILGCCKEKEMNGGCSESLGCGAFFFDENPCDNKFVLDALKAAKSFYTQLKAEQ